MTAMFQLTPFHDMHLVTVLAENIDKPLYLCHQNDDSLGWTTDRLEAKRFQYRRDAIEYVLQRTSLRIYREPCGKDGIYHEVRFDKKQVILGNHDGPVYTLTFDEAKAIRNLPIFKGDPA